MRQSTIGIRRMPSVEELRTQRTYAGQNASTNALNPSTSRLPALEEEVQLEPINTQSSTSTDSDGPQTEPNRLAKATSAVSAKLGLFKSKKGKDDGKQVQGAGDVPLAGPADHSWTNYSSNMVDVLDTVGTSTPIHLWLYNSDQSRSRSADSDIYN